MTMFLPSCVKQGLPHLHSSVSGRSARIALSASISARHRSRYAISMFTTPLLRAIPAADGIGERLRGRRSPRARLVGVTVALAAEHRIDDAPRRFDHVL